MNGRRFSRLVGNVKGLNRRWVLLSGNRPFGGRSPICPETVFEDGNPDGMIVGRENGRARTSPEGSLRIAKEAKGLNSWFVPLTVQKVTDLALTPICAAAQNDL